MSVVLLKLTTAHMMIFTTFGQGTLSDLAACMAKAKSSKHVAAFRMVGNSSWQNVVACHPSEPLIHQAAWWRHDQNHWVEGKYITSSTFVIWLVKTTGWSFCCFTGWLICGDELYYGKPCLSQPELNQSPADWTLFNGFFIPHYWPLLTDINHHQLPSLTIITSH